MAAFPPVLAKEFLKILRNRGARIVWDSKSFTIEDIFEIQPWLIKPNQEEISDYLGCEIKTLSQVLEKAAVFTEHGVINTMVTLGEKGAALLTFPVPIPRCERCLFLKNPRSADYSF